MCNTLASILMARLFALLTAALLGAALACSPTSTEPRLIAGGCGGGKPDQGGAMYTAEHTQAGYVLSVHTDASGDIPDSTARFQLSEAQWLELVEVVRRSRLTGWDPHPAGTVDDCVSCTVRVDERVFEVCGELEGGDRSVAVRSKLISLAHDLDAI